MNQTLERLASLGPVKFAEMLCLHEAHVRAIRPEILALSAGHADLRFAADGKHTNAEGVRQPAVLCMIGDLAAGLAMDAAVPNGASWAKTGMAVAYVAESQFDLRVVSDASGIDWSTTAPQTVSVEGRNHRDQVVFTAAITVVATSAA